jgi:hypothetical protein
MRLVRASEAKLSAGRLLTEIFEALVIARRSAIVFANYTAITVYGRKNQ